MKTTNPFKKAIENHLQKTAENDPLFAETLKKEKKNINDCITYILNQVKASGCNGFTDDEIFGIAVHYYDEDDIKNIKPISCRVVVNHSVELTEEDKKLAKEKAIEALIEESKVEARKNISENIELSPEDIEEAKKQAIARVVTEQKEKLVAKAAKKKPVTDVEQTDLFG